MHFGESFFDAAKRELEEELGIISKVITDRRGEIEKLFAELEKLS